MAIRWNDTVRATSNQVSANLGEEVAILQLDAGMYYGLNESGARLWQLLQDPIEVGALHEAIVGAFEVDGERAKADLLKVLGDMVAAGLIEVCRDDGQEVPRA